jgi:hypothetical protein
MKDGAGTLDFEGGEESEDESADAESVPEQMEEDTAESEPQGGVDIDEEFSEGTAEPSTTGTTAEQYPYFVRRNNVGDEREKRLEIHVRSKVAQIEPEFRAQLARMLGTDDVAKTDAREFALLVAFENPELVAEKMAEEGYKQVN